MVLMGYVRGDTIRFVATYTFDIRWCRILVFMKDFSSAASAVCFAIAGGLTLILGTEARLVPFPEHISSKSNWPNFRIVGLPSYCNQVALNSFQGWVQLS